MIRLPLLIVLSLLLISPLAAAADCPEPTPTAFIGFTAWGYFGDCVSLSPGSHDVYVSVSTIPTGRRVRFSVPDPPPGFIIIGEDWFYPYTGNRLTGIEMDFGCPPTAGHLGRITVLTWYNNLVCLPWQPTNVEIEDCSGELLVTSVRPVMIGYLGNCGGCFSQDCMGMGPYNLSPPDGATSVPLNTAFTWTAERYPDGPYDRCFIRIGTTPDCSNAQEISVPCSVDHSIVFDFLQPGTTYYWQAHWRYIGDGCSSGTWGDSEVHSFTTAGPLTTQAATWGKVKSMYRD